MNYNELTPIERHNNIFLKRDDLFAPLGIGNINGTKLRQCFALINSNMNKKIKGIITGCGINSPQSAIVSYVANYYKLPCIILVGGTNEERIKTLPYLKRSLDFGSKIINLKSGRHTVLYKHARDIVKNNDYFIVEYGINLKNNMNALIQSVANQVKNIPDNLDKLFITCGSGITSTGVLLGTYLFKKNIKEIILVGNAPNRENFIKENLEQLALYYKDVNITNLKFTFIDRYNNEPSFNYNKQEKASINNIELHPNYETKAWNFITKNKLYTDDEKVMFWIVGSYVK